MQTRQQYYGGPTGRGQMAIDNTLAQSQQALTGAQTGVQNNQYNQDTANALNTGNQLTNLSSQDYNLALQMLNLLQGKTSNTSGSTTNNPSLFGNLGTVGGILGAFAAL